MLSNSSYDFNNELDKYIEKLEKCEYISEKDVKLLCNKAKDQLSKEENVIYLESPITVINNDILYNIQIMLLIRYVEIYMVNFMTL